MEDRWLAGGFAAVLGACGPDVPAAVDTDDGSAGMETVSPATETDPTSTGTIETSHGEPTSVGESTGTPQSTVCALAPAIEDVPTPGSECTPGEAQPGGLCHDIVELELPETYVAGTDVFDIDGDALLDIVLAGDGWGGAVVSVEGAWPRPFAISSRSIGEGPVAAADLDDDTHADLLVGRSPVTLLYGANDGGFSGRIGSPVPAPLRDAIAIDVDGDGLDDLVVLHDDGSISTLHARGGDRLATAWVRSAGCLDPLAMVGGDFSGDGVVDLAVGTDGNVSVLVGDGSGAFEAGFGLDGVGRASAMAAADFDGDGLSEVAAIDRDAAVVRLFDASDDELVTVTTIDLEGTPNVIAAGDLQGDGSSDLVIAYADPRITWALGGGDGTFAAPETIDADHEATQLEVFDLDGDGRDDAMIADASGLLSTFLAEPDGALASVGIVFGDAIYESSTLADLDGDGLAERVSATADRLGVAAGLPGGEFALPEYRSFPESHQDLRFVLRARLDDDAIPDILVAGDRITTAALLGDGAGGLRSSSATSAADADLGEISVGDFDEDGHADFVMNGTSGVQVWRSNGSGGLEEGALLGPLDSLPTPHEVADLDGDGHLDVVWVPPFEGVAHAVLGDGTGAFGPIVTTDVGLDTHNVVLGDFDEDGVIDLFTELGDHIVVAAGIGDGSFAAPEPLLLTHSRPMVADFNGDGHLDVAGYAWLEGGTRVALGNGDGTLGDEAIYTGGFLAVFPRTADFNGDGLADALIHSELSTLRLLISNPCGCG